MKEYRYIEPHYQAEISVFVGGSPSELQKLIKRRHGHDAKIYSQNDEVGDESDDGTDAFQFHIINKQEEHFYIWLSRADLELLYHEIFHLTFDVLVTRGIEYDSSCEDAFAYWGAKVFTVFGKKLKVIKKTN